MYGRAFIKWVLVKMKEAYLQAKIKILKIYEISVVGCYRILEGNSRIFFLMELKLTKSSQKYWEKKFKNDKTSNNTYAKAVFFLRKQYMYDKLYDVEQ